MLFLEPKWLACPDPLLLLVASLLAGILLLSYHQLNINDRFQARIILVLNIAGTALAFCLGQGLMVTGLSVLPWSLYVSLIVSDIFHAGWRHSRPSENCCERNMQSMKSIEMVEDSWKTSRHHESTDLPTRPTAGSR